MKQKYLVMFIMICSLVLLAGWGKKEVKLLNDDTENNKLINLDKAIKESIPGVNSAEESETSDSTSVASDEKVLSGAASNDENSLEDKERIIVITVREKTITYDTEEYTDLNKLKAKIIQDNGEQVSFRLVDDFAESHIYKEVLSILSNLEAEIGLNYTKE